MGGFLEWRMGSFVETEINMSELVERLQSLVEDEGKSLLAHGLENVWSCS